MADTKISALTAVTTLTGASELAVNEAGTSKKATVTQLIANLDVIGQASVKHLASDHIATTTAPTAVSGLDMTLVAGTYTFKYWLLAQTATTSVGLNFAINYTGTANALAYALMWPSDGTTASSGIIDDASNSATGQVWAHNVSRSENTTTATVSTGTGGAAVADVNLLLEIEGIIVTSGGGNLELWHGSETATQTRLEGPGTSLIITRIA